VPAEQEAITWLIGVLATEAPSERDYLLRQLLRGIDYVRLHIDTPPDVPAQSEEQPS
jgi:hypothetical protein